MNNNYQVLLAIFFILSSIPIAEAQIGDFGITIDELPEYKLLQSKIGKEISDDSLSFYVTKPICFGSDDCDEVNQEIVWMTSTLEMESTISAQVAGVAMKCNPFGKCPQVGPNGPITPPKPKCGPRDSCPQVGGHAITVSRHACYQEECKPLASPGLANRSQRIGIESFQLVNSLCNQLSLAELNLCQQSDSISSSSFFKRNEQ